MAAFATTWICSYALWMLLACGNGGSFLGFLPGSELYLGLWVATAAAILSRGLFGADGPHGTLSVARFFRFVRYVLCDFFPELAKANLLVAKAVVTGRIDPGILKVETHLTRDDALAALANSITLTPGTLTVRVDDATNDLFVHFLNLPEGASPANDTLEADSLFEIRPCVRSIRKMYGEALPEPPKAPETPAQPAETAEVPPEMPEKAPETAEKQAESVENPAEPAEKPAEAVEKAPETPEAVEKAPEPVEAPAEPAEKPLEAAEKPAEAPETAEKTPELAEKPAETVPQPAETAEKPEVSPAPTPETPEIPQNPPENAEKQPENAPEVAP
jgi:multicomponent Na+:H+ antiporter subunit E